MSKVLTQPQEAFARGIASGLSQAEAYRRAYPKSQKWKPETVHQQASRLAALPHVAARVAAQAAAVQREFVVDTSALLREAHRLAHSDIGKIMHTEGEKAGMVKLPHELDDETRAAIAGFKIDEFGRIEYKFWDKNNAQERLFKHKGLFEKDNKQQQATVGVVRLVALKQLQDGDEDA